MVIKPSDIMSEYVSVSERNLQKKFEEARKLAFN
jgi:SpoVK/Ycf46/Vps4 family AAA+-type ATPase